MFDTHKFKAKSYECEGMYEKNYIMETFLLLYKLYFLE